MEIFHKYYIFVVYIILLFSTNSFAQLNGINTIIPSLPNFSGNPAGVSGKNYTSFNNAITALTTYGVNSAVILKVAAGTYDEQITIGNITGATAFKSITFQSGSLDSNSVVLTYSNTSTKDDWVVKLDSGRFITFRAMTIIARGIGVKFTNNADSNSLINNVITTTHPTGANAIAPVHFDYTGNQYNTIRNNLITGGNSGIFMDGYSSSLQNVIENNTIRDFYNYGIMMNYQVGTKIRNNKIQNSNTSSGSYGIYCFYGYDDVEISGNNIVINGAYGIYLDNFLGSTPLKGNIFNNFISVTCFSVYHASGIYITSSSYIDISSNSVYINTNSYINDDIYIIGGTSSSINLRNNIFSNFGSGYAINLGTASTLAVSNYNDLYTKGTYLCNSTSKAVTLADWRTLSANDANSVSVDPGFYSTTDLHINDLALNNTGTTIPGITVDIDMDTRSLTPDIGADEFTPVNNDAGVTAIEAPLPPCTGNNPVRVRIKNYGNSLLNTVIVNWQINGISQTPKSFSSLALSQYQESTVTLGSFTASAGPLYTLKFWTTLPNGVGDQNTRNDIFIYKNLKTGISGTFTIGSTSSDYTSFTAAVNDLVTSGICGPVKFRVRPGSYNENVYLPAIRGSSSTNTIVFESFNLDSNSVDLYYSASGSADNYIFQLNGASYVTIRSMKIRAIGGYYGTVFILRNGANYNTIFGNIISCYPGDYSSLVPIFNDYHSSDSYNKIINNIISGGYYGINFSGNNENFNIIQNNIIKDFYYYGISITGQNSPVVSGNTIQGVEDPSSLDQFYGIYAVAINDSMKIVKNKINVTGVNSTYGLYLGGLTASSLTYGLVANNFITLNNSYKNSDDYGIYVESANYLNILFNNTCINTTPNMYNGYAIYCRSGTYVNLINNIFSNFSLGYSIWVNSSSIISLSDYNDFYTNGTRLGFWNGTCSNLADLKKASSKDAHSVSTDPLFTSLNDLHVHSRFLDSAGQYNPLVNDDIDNETRNLLKPDIGADEFNLYHRDCGITGMISPVTVCTGMSNIFVKFRNYGLDTVKTAGIKWSVNGIPMNFMYYSGKLPYGKDTTLKIGSYTFKWGINYNIKIWVDTINGNPDQNHQNDTFFRNDLRIALAGTYSIGKGGKDFSSFTSAVEYMENFGVSGAVVFKVDSGTYSEQLSIPAITGATAINTITFMPVYNDSTSVLITDLFSNHTLNYIIQLDGAKYIHFQKIHIDATPDYSGGYAEIVLLKNNASHNVIMSCLLHAVNDNTGQSSGISLDDDAIFNNNYCTDNYFLNNRIICGQWGICLGGYSSSGSRNVIRGNIISGSLDGIRCLSQDSVEINGNTIIDSNFFGIPHTGIYCSDNSTIAKIINNKVILQSFGDGIQIYNYSGTTKSEFLVANNFISLLKGNISDNYGIYIKNCSDLKVYYNSVNLTNMNSAMNSAIYVTSDTNYQASKIAIQNNIAVFNGNGYVIYLDSNTVKNGSVNICNFNDFYCNSSNLGHYGKTDATDIYSWQKISGKDAGSVSFQPPFISNTDLHLSNYKALRKNNPLTEVLTDIDGEKRSPISPVIGADENPCFPVDAGILGIISPEKHMCDGIIPIIARLNNYGTNYLNNVSIDYLKNGIVRKTVNYIGHLKYLADTPVFICYDTFYTGNFYNVVIRTRNPNGITDPWTRDDADSVYDIKFSRFPVISSVTNDTICINDSATLKVSSPYSKLLFWYDSLKATTPFYYDSVFNTGRLTSSHTYYVEAGAPGYSDSITTSKIVSATEMGNMFDVRATVRDIVIDSFGINTIAPINTSVPIAVYYRQGSYKGHETTAFGWTLAAIDTVISNGPSAITFVPAGNIKIKKSDSIGIYITTTDPALSLNYTDGANMYEDRNIKITTGTKNFYPFDPFFQPAKTFMGTIYYSTGLLCISPRVPVYALVSPVPKLELGNDTFICNGHKLLLDAGFGLRYSYVWKYGNNPDTISLKQAIIVDSIGRYKVILSDKCGHIQADSINLTLKPSPKAIIQVNNSTQCLKNNYFMFNSLSTIPGGYIVSNFWNFGDTTYQSTLNAGHTYIFPGNFITSLVSISDNNCRDTATMAIRVKPNPVVSLGKDTVLKADQSITLDAGAGNDSYAWSTGNTNRKITVDSAGIGFNTRNFSVLVTKEGCTGGDTIRITFIKSQSIEYQLHDFSLKIFPNPASTLLNIMIEGFDNRTVILLNNMQGNGIYRSVIEHSQGKVMKQIDVSGLPAGIYLLKIYNESIMKIVKFIKN